MSWYLAVESLIIKQSTVSNCLLLSPYKATAAVTAVGDGFALRSLLS
jgi:hypothetical protein